MAETVDIIYKLMALALNNPNEHEAQSAAMKAVRMIVDNDVAIGSLHSQTRAKVVPLTPEENVEFSAVMSAIMTAPNPDNFKPATTYQDYDLDDGFMKKRLISAWRQLREHRKRVEGECHRLKIDKPNWML